MTQVDSRRCRAAVRAVASAHGGNSGVATYAAGRCRWRAGAGDPVRTLARLAGRRLFLPVGRHHPVPARPGGSVAASCRQCGSGRPCLTSSAVLTGWLLAMTLPPGTVVGRAGRRVHRHVIGQAGLWRYRPERLQPGDGGAGRAAGVVPGVADPVGHAMPLSGRPGRISSTAAHLPVRPADADAISSARLLGHVKTELSRRRYGGRAGRGACPGELVAGRAAGQPGEPSAGPILVGGLFMIGTADRLAPAAGDAGWPGHPGCDCQQCNEPTRYLGAAQHLLSGAAMLGAFSSSPITSPRRTIRAGSCSPSVSAC